MPTPVKSAILHVWLLYLVGVKLLYLFLFGLFHSMLGKLGKRVLVK